MSLTVRWRWFPLALVVAASLGAVYLTDALAAPAEPRTWTDATGKYSVAAEFVDVKQQRVVLKKADGETIKIPLAKLSGADRDFVKAALAAKKAVAAQASPDAALAAVVQEFYAGLRDADRSPARKTLTKEAQAATKGSKSALAALPSPEEGARSIRAGRAKMFGEVAEVAVAVRAGGRVHDTTVYLRLEDAAWRVFALSAVYPEGEAAVDFESAPVAPGAADPFAALVGKPLTIVGNTLEGEPIDLAEYEGQVVLIDFWATWCGPCRAEIPNIQANYDRYHGEGFDVISVSVDKDLAALGSFLAEENPPWAVIADRAPGNRNPMAAQYGIRSIPAFILVGEDGRVAAVNCRGERLGKELARLFNR